MNGSRSSCLYSGFPVLWTERPFNNNNDNNRNDEDYDVQEFTGEFNGKIQKFIAKETGKYKIECWGARGGASRINGTLGYSYRKWWICIRHN